MIHIWKIIPTGVCQTVIHTMEYNTGVCQTVIHIWKIIPTGVCQTVIHTMEDNTYWGVSNCGTYYGR